MQLQLQAEEEVQLQMQVEEEVLLQMQAEEEVLLQLQEEEVFQVRGHGGCCLEIRFRGKYLISMHLLKI